MSDLVVGMVELTRDCLDNVLDLRKVLEDADFTEAESCLHLVVIGSSIVLDDLEQAPDVFSHDFEVGDDDDGGNSCGRTSAK